MNPTQSAEVNCYTECYNVGCLGVNDLFVCWYQLVVSCNELYLGIDHFWSSKVSIIVHVTKENLLCTFDKFLS